MRNPQHQQKISVYERVHMLSQKINSAPLSKPHNTAKRYDNIDAMCDYIQNNIQDFKAFFDEKMIDIKHTTSKISKQIKKDNNSMDSMVRQQLANTNQRMLTMIDHQYEQRKSSDAKMAAFINQQSNTIRQLIQSESGKREQQGSSIKQSLTADIEEIKRILNQTSIQYNTKMQKTQSQLFTRADNITAKLKQICTSYSDNQSEFYKMLRDIVKKVKAELSEHQSKREETETQILNLIEKMCDRAISSKNI